MATATKRNDRLIPLDTNFKFFVERKIRWVDIDAQCVLNNAHYLTFFEEARSEYFGKSRGLNLVPEREETQIYPFLLLRTDVRFLKPGKAGRDILVDIKTIELGSSSFTQWYRIRDKLTGDIMSEAEAILVCYDFDAKKSCKMSDHFRRTITEFEGSELSPKPAVPTVSPAQQTIRTNYDGKEQLRVGMFAEIRKAFTEQHVRAFAALSEDFNPLHLDAQYAAKTRFKERIVHGALFSSLISGLFGTYLPGEGAIYMHQNNKFVAPVALDEEIVARVELTSLDKDKCVASFSTTCTSLKTGKVVLQGDAALKVPKEKIDGSAAASSARSKL